MRAARTEAFAFRFVRICAKLARSVASVHTSFLKLSAERLLATAKASVTLSTSMQHSSSHYSAAAAG